MKLTMKCIHCESEKLTIVTSHTGIVNRHISNYVRVDRESVESFPGETTELSKNSVIVSLQCNHCEKLMDLDIINTDGRVVVSHYD